MTLLDTTIAAPESAPPTDEIRALAERVVVDRDATPFGVYVFGPDDHASLLGRHVEAEVFASAFGNSPALLQAEYGRYEAATAFAVVVDHRRLLPAGAMRLITPSPAGFKTLDEIEAVWHRPVDEVLRQSELTLPRDRVWDVATLAVAPDYRGKATAGLVSLALYRALCRGALACDVGWWVTILDAVVLRTLQWQLHKPFASFQGVAPREYLGSASSLPAWCDVAAWRQRLLDDGSPVHDTLFGDDELTAAVAGPDPAVFARYAPAGAEAKLGAPV